MVPLKREYPYKDVDMTYGAGIVVQSFKERIPELKLVNSRWTAEYADDLDFRLNDITIRYIGEPYNLMVKEATEGIEEIKQNSLRWLQVIKTTVEEYCVNSDNILTGLGFKQFWRQADEMNDQNSLIGLLDVFSRNIDKYRSEIEAKGVTADVLDETANYGNKLKLADRKQEGLKFTTV